MSNQSAINLRDLANARANDLGFIANVETKDDSGKVINSEVRPLLDFTDLIVSDQIYLADISQFGDPDDKNSVSAKCLALYNSLTKEQKADCIGPERLKELLTKLNALATAHTSFSRALLEGKPSEWAEEIRKIEKVHAAFASTYNPAIDKLPNDINFFVRKGQNTLLLTDIFIKPVQQGAKYTLNFSGILKADNQYKSEIDSVLTNLSALGVAVNELQSKQQQERLLNQLNTLVQSYNNSKKASQKTKSLNELIQFFEKASLDTIDPNILKEKLANINFDKLSTKDRINLNSAIIDMKSKLEVNKMLFASSEKDIVEYKERIPKIKDEKTKADFMKNLKESEASKSKETKIISAREAIIGNFTTAMNTKKKSQSFISQLRQRVQQATGSKPKDKKKAKTQETEDQKTVNEMPSKVDFSNLENVELNLNLKQPAQQKSRSSIEDGPKAHVKDQPPELPVTQTKSKTFTKDNLKAAQRALSNFESPKDIKRREDRQKRHDERKPQAETSFELTDEAKKLTETNVSFGTYVEDANKLLGIVMEHAPEYEKAFKAAYEKIDEYTNEQDRQDGVISLLALLEKLEKNANETVNVSAKELLEAIKHEEPTIYEEHEILKELAQVVEAQALEEKSMVHAPKVSPNAADMLSVEATPIQSSAPKIDIKRGVEDLLSAQATQIQSPQIKKQESKEYINAATNIEGSILMHAYDKYDAFNKARNDQDFATLRNILIEFQKNEDLKSDAESMLNVLSKEQPELFQIDQYSDQEQKFSDNPEINAMLTEELSDQDRKELNEALKTMEPFPFKESQDEPLMSEEEKYKLNAELDEDLTDLRKGQCLKAAKQCYHDKDYEALANSIQLALFHTKAGAHGELTWKLDKLNKNDLKTLGLIIKQGVENAKNPDDRKELMKQRIGFEWYLLDSKNKDVLDALRSNKANMIIDKPRNFDMGMFKHAVDKMREQAKASTKQQVVIEPSEREDLRDSPKRPKGMG